MERAFAVLSQEEPDEDVAALAAQLGRFMFFAGEHGRSHCERIETALELAEALSLPEVLSQALNTKAIILVSHGRQAEGLALLRYALEVALEHDKPSAALRAYYNLADPLATATATRRPRDSCGRDSPTPARSATATGSGGARLRLSVLRLGAWDECLEMRDVPEGTGPGWSAPFSALRLPV